MTRKISTTESRLMEIQASITKWNDFVRELQVPGDMAPAISTGRLELLRLAQPRALSTDECAILYQLVGGLLETNQALQRHASLISNLAAEVHGSIAGAEGIAGRLEAYANYREPRENDADEP